MFNDRLLTVAESVANRAATEGERTAVVFLADGTGDGEPLSYAALDRRARAVAARLRRQLPRGARVLLMCPPGLDYVVSFVSCLYAGIVAVPAYPPSPLVLERDLDRLRRVVADAEATVALTTSAWVSLAEAAGLTVAGEPVQWLCVDEPAGAEGAAGPEPRERDDLAFLQYTSGSTSDPKGVMVSQGNLAANLTTIAEVYGLRDGQTIVSWLPPYHDMGLIGIILGGLRFGCRVVLMPPDAFLRRPIRWLQAISRFGAYVTAAPNFAYELAVRRSTEKDREALDLSGCKVAINGAEPVVRSVLDRFAEAFGPHGFRTEAMWPSYGLAESTLLVSAGRLGVEANQVTLDPTALAAGRAVPAAAGRALVSCAAPPAESGVAIVDPQTGELLGEGRIGEITLCGPAVAAGYWARPEETAATFREDPLGSSYRRMYTGDLGCFVGGELFVTGRAKDLIVVRGRNHYPQDIEQTMADADAAIRRGCGAAFAVPGPDGERLVLVQEIAPERTDDPDAVLARLRQAVTAAHNVTADAIVLLAPRTVPKTSSGKIRRAATREAFESGNLDVVHAWRTARWS
jgi:acyl-CoA synthetase (AMP-forming)/AMP-acid ligase II